MKFGTLYAYWTHEWTGDYKFFAKKIKDAGFDIMEISAGDLLTMSDRELDELKAVAKDLGLDISSNIGPAKKYDVASSDPETRKRGIQFLSDILKKMDRLDSRALVGVTYTYWPNDFSDLDKPAIWERGVKGVREFGKVAEDLGITVALEIVNRFETLVLNTAEEGVRFCEEVGMDSVKLLLDTFHMNIEEDSMIDAIHYAAQHKKIGEIHMGESNRRVPGTGKTNLDWPGILKTLKESGYDGWVSMEYERRWQPQDLPDAKEGMKRGGDYIRRILESLE